MYTRKNSTVKDHMRCLQVFSSSYIWDIYHVPEQKEITSWEEFNSIPYRRWEIIVKMNAVPKERNLFPFAASVTTAPLPLNCILGGKI